MASKNNDQAQAPASSEIQPEAGAPAAEPQVEQPAAEAAPASEPAPAPEPPAAEQPQASEEPSSEQPEAVDEVADAHAGVRAMEHSEGDGGCDRYESNALGHIMVPVHEVALMIEHGFRLVSGQE